MVHGVWSDQNTYSVPPAKQNVWASKYFDTGGNVIFDILEPHQIPILFSSYTPNHFWTFFSADSFNSVQTQPPARDGGGQREPPILQGIRAMEELTNHGNVFC